MKEVPAWLFEVIDVTVLGYSDDPESQFIAIRAEQHPKWQGFGMVMLYTNWQVAYVNGLNVTGIDGTPSWIIQILRTAEEHMQRSPDAADYKFRINPYA